MASETPSIPLGELLSSKTSRNPLRVLQKIFPDLQENELETVVGLKAGIRLKRQYSPLVKYVEWSPRRNEQAEGLSPEAMIRYIETIGTTATRLGDLWVNNENIDVIPASLSRNWDLGVQIGNHAAWKIARQKSIAQLFDAPPVDTSPSAKARHFDVVVHPVVVNPERPTEVWQSGRAVALPTEYASWDRPQQEEWWNTSRQSLAQSLQEEFGFLQLPRVMRPQVSLRWNVVSPDGQTRAYDDRIANADTTSWKSTAAGVSWLNAQKERVIESYKNAGRWAALLVAGRLDIPASAPKEAINAAGWDLIDQTPLKNLEQFDHMMRGFAQNNSDAFALVNQSMVDTLQKTVLSQQGWSQHSWIALPQLRQWYSERDWVSDDMLGEWIMGERKGFVSACRNTSALDQYAASLSAEQKDQFKALFYWNGCDISTSLKEALDPIPAAVEQAIVIDNAAPAAASSAPSVTDWSRLCDAFEVNAPTDEDSMVHPFSNWMDRLAPPGELKDVTTRWLTDNEKFNDINRLILRKKDTDEAHLNAELAEKLKNVVLASNSILEENHRSGGWWGRIRKGFAEGNASEKWADTFLDFQNHMLVVFDSINKQVERDRVWLSYADTIGAQSEEVDRRWSSWMADTARSLDEERQAALDSTSITSEKKIDWNNRVDLLDSARVAHEHIRTANGITNVLLEKVRQSADIKERLQQRSMMFYWSSLNMFAGLQSLQRNTNAILEQSEMVEAMSKSFEALATRSLKEETEQKEKIREAFKKMSESEQAMRQFHESIAMFQKDAVMILGDLNISREQMQEETISVSLSTERVQKKRAVEVEVEKPSSFRFPSAP